MGFATGIGAALQVAGFGGSFVYQRNKQRSQRRALEREGLLTQQLDGIQTNAINIACGYTSIIAVPIYEQVSHNRNVRADNRALPTENAFGAIINHRGLNRNEFLLRLYVACQGPINNVYDVRIDGSKIGDTNPPDLAYIQYGGNGRPFSVATDFHAELTNNFKFTGLTGVVGLYRWDFKTKPFVNFPNVQLFMEGGLWPDVNADGTYNPVVTFTNNPARILLGYLLNTTYGPGLSPDDINLESFRRVIAIGNKPFLGVGSSTSNQGTLPPELREELGRDFAFRNIQDYVRSKGFTGVDDAGTISQITRINRFTFDGLFSSLESHESVISNLLIHMPGIFMTNDEQGRIKLNGIDFVPGQATEDYAQDLELTWEMFDPNETIDFSLPDVTQRLNQATVGFVNANKSYQPDEITFPEVNSGSWTDLLAKDNNIRRATTFSVDGANNPYSATAIASYDVRRSRTRFGRGRIGPVGMLLESGDVHKLTLKYIDSTDPDNPVERTYYDGYILITTINPTDTLYFYDMEFMEFKPGNFMPITDSKQPVLDYTPVDLSIGDVTNVMATAFDARREVVVTFRPNEDQDAAVVGYEIQEVNPEDPIYVANNEEGWTTIGLEPFDPAIEPSSM